VSVTGRAGVGIPVILLHDAEGSVVTIEMKNGFILQGLLDDASDNMNCTLKVNIIVLLSILHIVIILFLLM